MSKYKIPRGVRIIQSIYGNMVLIIDCCNVVKRIPTDRILSDVELQAMLEEYLKGDCEDGSK